MDEECEEDSTPIREISISRTLDRSPNRSLITEQIDVTEGGEPSRILRTLNIPCDENPGECGREVEEQPRTVGENITEREAAAYDRYMEELAIQSDDECLYDVSAPTFDYTGASSHGQSSWLMNFSKDDGGTERDEECLEDMRQNLGPPVSQGQRPGAIDEIRDFMIDYDEGAGFQGGPDEDLMYFSQGDLMEFSRDQTNQSQGGGGGGRPEARQECLMDFNQTQEPSPETRRYLEEVRRRTQTPPTEPPRQQTLRPDVQYLRERERAMEELTPTHREEHLQFLEAEHYVGKLESIRNMELAEEERFEEAKCLLNQSIRNPQRLQEEIQYLNAEHEAKMACFQNIRCTLERPAIMVTPRPEDEEIAEEPPVELRQRRKISIVTPTTLAEMAFQREDVLEMPPSSPGRPPAARRSSVCTPQGRPSGPAAAAAAARSESADRAAAVKAAREKYAKMKPPSVPASAERQAAARRSSVCTPQGRPSESRSESADRAAAVKAAREKYAKMKPPSVPASAERQAAARRSSVCTPQGGPGAAASAGRSVSADRAAAVKAAREKYAKIKPPSVPAAARRSSVCTPHARPFGFGAAASAGRSVSADRAAAIKAAREKYAKIKPPSAQLPPERQVAAQRARRQVCSEGAARRPKTPDASAGTGPASRRRLFGELEQAAQSAGPAARAALEQLPRHVCPGVPALQQQANREYTQAVERAKKRIQDPEELNIRLTTLKEEYRTKLDFICRLKELKGVAYQRFVQEFEELDTAVDDAEERRAMVDFLTEELDAYISHLHEVVGAESRQRAMSTCRRGSRPSLPRPVTPPPVIRKPTAQQIAEIKKRYTIKPGAPLPAPQPNVGPPTRTARKLEAERSAAIAERRRRASEPNPVAAARAKYIHDPGTKFQTPNLVMKPKLPKSAPCKKVSAQELGKSLADLKRRYTLTPGQQLPGAAPRIGGPSKAALKLKAERISAAAERQRRASVPCRIQEARRKFSAPGIGLQQEPGARRPSATNIQTKAMRKILAEKCAAAERQRKGSAPSRIAEARKRFSAPGIGLQQQPGARRPSAPNIQTKAMRKILAEKCAAAERQRKGSVPSRIAEARKKFSAPGIGLQQQPGARRPSATQPQTKAMRKILAQKCAAAAEHQRRVSEGSRIAEARKKYMNVSKTKIQTPKPCPPTRAAQRILQEKRAFQAELTRKADEAKRVAEARRQFSLPGVGLPMECSPEPLPEGPAAQLGQLVVRSPPPKVQRKKRIVKRLPQTQPRSATQPAATAAPCPTAPKARVVCPIRAGVRPKGAQPRSVPAQPSQVPCPAPAQRAAARPATAQPSRVPCPARPTAAQPRRVPCPAPSQRAAARPATAQPSRVPCPAPAQRAAARPATAQPSRVPCPAPAQRAAARPATAQPSRVPCPARPPAAQPRRVPCPAPAQRAAARPATAQPSRVPCPARPTAAQPRRVPCPAPAQRAAARPATAQPSRVPCPARPTAAQPRRVPCPAPAQRAAARPATAQPSRVPCPAPAQRAAARPATAQPSRVPCPAPAQRAAARPATAQPSRAPCPARPTAAQPSRVPCPARPTAAQPRRVPCPAPAQRAAARPATAQPSRVPCPAPAQRAAARPATAQPSRVPCPARPTAAQPGRVPCPAPAQRAAARTTSAQPSRVPCPAEAKKSRSAVPKAIARAMENKTAEDVRRMNDELKIAVYQKKKKMEKLPPTVQKNLSKRVAAEMGTKSAIEKEQTDGVFKSMMLQKRGVDLKSDPKKVAPRLIPSNAKKLKVIGNALESVSEGVITHRVPTSNINGLDNVAAEEIAITLRSQLKKPAKGDVARKALSNKQFNIVPAAGGGGEPPDNDYYECDVILDKLNATNQFQARGSALPKWSPGYYTAYPVEKPNLILQKSPSDVFIKAWQLMKPEFLNKSR